jgi:hypothetical protein
MLGNEFLPEEDANEVCEARGGVETEDGPSLGDREEFPTWLGVELDGSLWDSW